MFGFHFQGNNGYCDKKMFLHIFKNDLDGVQENMEKMREEQLEELEKTMQNRK